MSESDRRGPSHPLSSPALEDRQAERSPCEKAGPETPSPGEWPAAAEASFRQMAENAREVFWIFTPDFSETIYVNPAYERLFGHSTEHVLRRPEAFLEAVHADDAEILAAAMREVRRAPQEDVEFRVVHRDGSVRWARARGFPVRDASGEVVRVVGSTEDITARKEAEARLTAAEAHYRWLVDNAPYAIYALDAEGCFIELNPAGSEFVRRPADEILGQHFSTVIAPVDLEVATEAFEQVMAGEADGLVFEERILLPSGEERLIEVTESAIRENGVIVGTHGIARDITGEAEREGRLRRAERLASLGTLVSGVAHELNNPLHSIMNYATLLLDRARSAEEREDLETIQREAVRAAGIVSDLRVLGQGTEDQVDERAAVDLNDVVRHVLRTRQYVEKTRGIEVVESLSQDLPAVCGRRGRLEQVVLNLVVNAEHAIEGCEARRITVRTRGEGGRVIVEVADTGSGLSEQDWERVFDPFYTTRAPGEGTGLGLSLVQSIVGDHGGTVQAERRESGGTTFRVELPAGARSAPAYGEPDESGCAGAPKPLRVLVVDDEPAIRTALSRYLERRRGHEVEEAGDGEEALRIIERAGSDFDVIVSDLRMPGLGGDQLLARLREMETGLERRMMFLTGDAASGHAARILESVDLPVVYKPVDLPELADRIERYSARVRAGT